MNTSYKAVIFDLDGVICSTDTFHYLAWKRLADRLGIPFDEQVNHRLRGVSRMESLEILLEKSTKTYSPEEKAAFAEEKNGIYRDFLQTMTVADRGEGVFETLKTLRAKGYRMAIGSSSRNAPLILEKIEMADCFDAIVDGNSITHSKPDPEVFLKAAKAVNVFADECLVVEDAVSGLEAAKAAGMRVAGMGDASKNALADFALNSFSDLLNLL